MWLVQGQMGRLLADHPTHPDRRHRQPRSSGSQACVRSHDGHDEARHCKDRGGAKALNADVWSHMFGYAERLSGAAPGAFRSMACEPLWLFVTGRTRAILLKKSLCDFCSQKSVAYVEI